MIVFIVQPVALVLQHMSCNDIGHEHRVQPLTVISLIEDLGEIRIGKLLLLGLLSLNFKRRKD